MTISITPRFGLTTWDSPDDQVTREQFTANFAAIDALGAQCTIDVRANRPVPGTGQRFFFAEDQGVLYYDTGSAWQVVLFTPDAEVTTGTRPAAGSRGKYYFETDTQRLFRDAGTRFVEILTSAVIPAGIIMPTLAAAQPSGWLFCDGSAYSQGQYPDLYAAIGTKFGSSGANFRVPDLRGVFLAGAPSLGAGGFGQLGAHGHGTHNHHGDAPFADHKHVYGTTVDPEIAHAYTWSAENLAAPNPGTSDQWMAGTVAPFDTAVNSVPAAPNVLTYLYASYLIKATGGPRD